MGRTEQEMELDALRIEVAGLRRALEEAQAEVDRLRKENADLALALSVLRQEVVAQIQDGAVAEWAAELLTAFADRGVAVQYSGEWQEAHNRFWQALQRTPAAVRERVDPERVYFLEAK